MPEQFILDGDCMLRVDRGEFVLAEDAKDLVDEVNRLRARVSALEGTLGLLADHQNGCPLPSYEDEWGRAMESARALLGGAS